jgi:predicted ribosomally synthesized peptide with nif11-like leader
MRHGALAGFLNRLRTDEALRASLEEHFGDLSGDIPAEDVSDFAAAQGYDFTVDELEEELADEILAGVAGGGIQAFPKVEIDLTSTYDSEEIKVTYTPNTRSFNFLETG